MVMVIVFIAIVTLEMVIDSNSSGHGNSNRNIIIVTIRFLSMIPWRVLYRDLTESKRLLGYIPCLYYTYNKYTFQDPEAQPGSDSAVPGLGVKEFCAGHPALREPRALYRKRL